MSNDSQSWQCLQPTSMVPRVEQDSENRWYAVHTRARHEKAIAARLQEQGFAIFLPTVVEVHRWSDRRKKVEVPLFSCYVFAKLNPTNPEHRFHLYRLNAVFGVVGVRGDWTAIPEEQITAVRVLLEEEVPWAVHPFLKIGQRIRVRGGSMDGIEGVLLSRNGDRTLIISIDAIQRSLAVRVEGYDIEPV
jgi:transcription antitermination factor NusG